MSRPETGEDTEQLIAELLDELQALQDELEPGRGLRPPTRQELALFTSDVAIPALVVLLRTNIQVLKLLQRTLRMANGRYDPDESESEVRDRAERVGRATLTRLDERLEQLQTAVTDDQTRDLVTRIRELQDELEAATTPESQDRDTGGDTVTGPEPGPATETVEIDVESELESLKDDVADDDNEDS